MPLFFIIAIFASWDYDFEANVKDMERLYAFDTGSIYFSEPTPEELTPYEQLVKYANKEQISSLLNHPHVMVRAHGHAAFSERYPREWLPLAISNLHDQTKLQRSSGCFTYQAEMGDLILDWVDDILDSMLHQETLTPQEVEWVRGYQTNVIDLLFTQKPQSRNLRYILHLWDIPLSYDDQVRSLAKTGVKEALIALAKYGRSQDASIIAEQLSVHQKKPYQNKEALKATLLLPYYDYERKLTDIHQGMLKDQTHTFEHRLFFKTLMINRHPSAAQMMLESLKAVKQKRLEKRYASSIHDALVFYPHVDTAQFQDVLFELWQAFGLLSDRQFNQLWQLNPSRCIKQLSSQNLPESEWHDSNHDHSFSISHAAQTIFESRGAESMPILQHMMAGAPGIDFEPFLITMVEKKTPNMLPFLMARLENTNDFTDLEWIMIGLRHLAPDSFKTMISERIDQNPDWEEIRPCNFCESKAAYLKSHLESTSSLSKAIKLRETLLEKSSDSKAIPSFWFKEIEDP